MTDGTKIWEGVYASWEEARDVASTAAAAFSSDRWMARITQQLEDYRRERATHGFAAPPRPTHLPWLCALTRPRTIVDFGGSSGWCWDYLRDVVPNLTVTDYTIVETEVVVELMQQSKLHVPPVSYVSDASSLGARDVVYSNSVLQYFGSNAPILDLVRATRPGWVLLEDLFANDERDSFSTQLYYGIRMPHRFIGLGALREQMSQLGYTVRLRAPFIYPMRGSLGPLPMDNLPEDFRVRYSSTVLFERNS